LEIQTVGVNASACDLEHAIKLCEK